MRTQRLSKPSKRVLENLENALERQNSNKKRRHSAANSPRNQKPPKKHPKQSSKQQKKPQSTFAEFIERVHEVQTLTHPSNSQGSCQYPPNYKPLKLQRQMRLIDLDVQSSSSNEDNYSSIFDEFTDDMNEIRFCPPNRKAVRSSTHSRSSSTSDSSLFDRTWTKFNHGISLLNTQTGSDGVDNIINQYQSDHMIMGYDMFDNRHTIIGNVNNGDNDDNAIADDNENEQDNEDDIYINDTTIIDDDDLYIRNNKLPTLDLKHFKQITLQQRKNDNLLLSPTSSFNMLTSDMPPISRDSSLNSITSTAVNIPMSPNLDIDEGNDANLQAPSLSYNDSLSKYINIECSTNQTTGSPITKPKFSFDYRQNNDNCLNLTVDKSIIDTKPSPLTNRAIWRGSEAEMINGEAEVNEMLI